MKTKIKGLSFLAVMVMMIAALSLTVVGGCTPAEANPEGSQDPEDTGLLGEEKGSLEVLLYFADPNAVDTGAEGEHGYVVPVARSVEKGEDLLLRTLKELISGPREEEGSYYNTLPMTTGIVKVALEGNTAVIEFTYEVLSDNPGGTLSGTVFIQSVVMTATQFSEVEQVLVVVNGEPWCDGHFLWDEPVGRNDLF